MASSSSGAKPRAKASAYCSKGGSKAGPSCETEALAVPHSECIALDQVGPQSWQLTNFLTNEVVLLPAGEWAMELHSTSGDEAVFQEANEMHPDGQVLLLGDKLMKVVFRPEEGELFVREGDKVGSLDSLRTRFVPAEVLVESGVSCAKYKLEAYAFHMTRPLCQRVMWDIAQFHTVFKMKTHKGRQCPP